MPLESANDEIDGHAARGRRANYVAHLLPAPALSGLARPCPVWASSRASENNAELRPLASNGPFYSLRDGGGRLKGSLPPPAASQHSRWLAGSQPPVGWPRLWPASRLARAWTERVAASGKHGQVSSPCCSRKLQMQPVGRRRKFAHSTRRVSEGQQRTPLDSDSNRKPGQSAPTVSEPTSSTKSQ